MLQVRAGESLAAGEQLFDVGVVELTGSEALSLEAAEMQDFDRHQAIGCFLAGKIHASGGARTKF